MAKTWKTARDKRDGSTFVALPFVVIDSPGYRAASHTARSLLLDLARQFRGHNNGKLTACRKYLGPLGWRSNDVIVRARRELIDCRLIVETRKGARPNRAAWYALAWQKLDVTVGLEIDPKLYRTGGYMHPDIEPKAGASLGPLGGAGCGAIAPRRGPAPSPPVPSHGAIRSMNGNALHRATGCI
jgi:hypothetical protein